MKKPVFKDNEFTHEGQQLAELRSEHGTSAIGERGGGVAPW